MKQGFLKAGEFLGPREKYKTRRYVRVFLMNSKFREGTKKAEKMGHGGYRGPKGSHESKNVEISRAKEDL